MVSSKLLYEAAALLVVLVELSSCGSSGASTPEGSTGGNAGGGASGNVGGSHAGSAGSSASSGGAGGSGFAGNSSGAGAGGAGAGGAGGSTATACGFIGGDVTAATYPGGLTLTKACSPYIIDSLPGINVADGGMLTIDAGVTVKFTVNSVLMVGATGSGKILANGTAQDPIMLTSNPTDPMPAAGDWYGIDFSAGTASGSKLSYPTEAILQVCTSLARRQRQQAPSRLMARPLT
jgi:hypothetical protein